ncbi:MAG TPA: hypothetical protein PK770_05520, partial [Kiritimatiellia bacterium]|nr:hypothetical protein [Kiritimatiellia bacterium]
WVDYGWSKSKLADPMSSSEKVRRTKQRWATEDANHKAEKEYERLLDAREEQLRERARKDAEDVLKRAKQDAEKTAEGSDDDDDTEAKLRDLLEKLKAKKARESTAAAPVPDATESVIRVTDSVEILGKGAGSPPQAATPETPKP